jgi:hypothetical protein
MRKGWEVRVEVSLTMDQVMDITAKFQIRDSQGRRTKGKSLVSL